MKKRAERLFCMIATLVFLFVLEGPSMAKKPPWAGEDWNPSSPPVAPEPMALTLIGMGASGAVGYYLGKRKRNRDRFSEKRTGHDLSETG